MGGRGSFVDVNTGILLLEMVDKHIFLWA